MSFFNILIPLVGGLMLAAFPQIFTKATGESLRRAKDNLRKTGFLLIGVAAIYSVVKLTEPPARQIPTGAQPKIDMHRLQATTPGDSGWYLAESTEGSFSVQLPIPFNDFTVIGDDPNSGAFKAYAVGGQSPEGMKFSVVEAPNIPGKAHQDFNQIPKDLATEGQKVFDITNASFDGFPALSFSTSSSTSSGYTRYVQTETSVITIILEYPTTSGSKASQFKSRFLDSLKIKPKKSLYPSK